MAKLNQGGPATPQAPPPQAPQQSTQAPTAPVVTASSVLPAGIAVSPAGPVAFSVALPSTAPKKPSKAAKGPAKPPRVSGQAWFDANFSGKAEDVVQIRNYPDRRHGFHCAPCGIAGSRAIIILGKDGRGNDIQLYKVNPQTKEMEVDRMVKGFEVGETCLKKYGHVDLKKIGTPSAA